MPKADFSIPRALAITLIAVVPALIALTVMQWSGPFSWDDGTITLAFGKTLFETGRFALTPVSPVVEGSSSLLYAVLTGLAQAVGGLGFEAAITASRLISALFASASALLLLYAIAPTLGRGPALIVAVVYAFLPLNYAEIYNGMEMLAFGFLLLAWCVFLRDGRDRAALVMLPLLLLCRFEASFYIGFALTAAWVFCGDSALRRRLLLQFVVLCAAFLVITAGRYAVFGVFLPNTILAKMHEPYTHSGLKELERKLAGLWEFVSFYGLPLLCALYAIWRQPGLRGRVEPWMLLGIGVFAGLSGENWGYAGRMTLGALPFAVMFLTDAYGRRSDAQSKQAVGVVLLMTLATHGIAGLPAVQSLRRDIANGLAYEQFRLRDQAYTDPTLPFTYGQYGVTPENYRITGEAVTRLADRLDLPVIRFAVPDVGGLGLCCARIEVMDTALLTNPELARKGWGFFGEQLARLRPDVVQAHEVWAIVSGIYELPEFSRDYVPILFENTLFYLRSDHLERLRDLGGVTETSPAALDFDKVRYADFSLDQVWLNSQPVIYRIDPAPAQ